jgi:hypothetical protein
MRYDVKVFPLIPLNRPKAVLTLPNGVKKPLGKAPRDAKWTAKTYNSENVRTNAIAEGRNVGVRLTDDLLIIDVDPRNGGEAGFANLCHDIGIDGDRYPRVITGSGGWHCYMRKPNDLLVRDTLEAEEYNGVEFKSRGRQVVAAGSIHPETGKPYYWSSDHPAIEDGLPPVPKRLLNIIKRPARSTFTSKGGGTQPPEQIAAKLAALNPADFGTNDLWFPIMVSAHFLSAGEARQEFIDWSTSDPNFAGDAYMIGKRWDSLHADKSGAITGATLDKALRDHGDPTKVRAAIVPDDEFPDDNPADDDSWLEGGPLFEDWLEGKKPKPIIHQVGGLLYQNASEAEPERIDWLWPDRFASGKINFVAGFPDQGKSQVTCDMAARVSTGANWPNDEGQAPLGTVLMLSAEDGTADTIVPRLKAAGADLDKIKIVAPTVKTDDKGRRMFNFAEDLNRLTGLVRHCNDVRLVIIDPISAYMGGKGTADTYKNTEVRAVLAPLAEWAEQHGLAVVFVSHFNKNGSGRALSRLTDSLAFGALARCGWLVVPESDGDGETGRKLFLRGKNNLAADAGGIAYTIESATVDDDIGSSRIIWHERVQVTADDAMSQGDVKATAQDRAVEFLSTALADGPVPVSELKERATAQSISWRTVERAKDLLGVTSQKLDFGRGWQWRAYDDAEEMEFG